MEELYQSLLELQELDEEIRRTEAKFAEFDTLLEEIEAPVVALEREFDAGTKRLDELRQDARRLSRAAEEKRERLKKTEERLERVRNPREEGAIRTELHLVQTAVEADETEALQVMDEVTRAELKLDELEKKLNAARNEVEPRREVLLSARAEVEGELGVLGEKRESRMVRLDPQASRLYERVKSGRTRVVIAGLTADGACGHCFGMIPLQQQTEIRQAEHLVRCEACGVILHPGG